MGNKLEEMGVKRTAFLEEARLFHSQTKAISVFRSSSPVSSLMC